MGGRGVKITADTNARRSRVCELRSSGSRTVAERRRCSRRTVGSDCLRIVVVPRSVSAPGSPPSLALSASMGDPLVAAQRWDPHGRQTPSRLPIRPSSKRVHSGGSGLTCSIACRSTTAICRYVVPLLSYRSIAESPVDAPCRLDLVVAIVPIAQAVRDRVGVVEGRRQFVFVLATPGRLSGSVRADDDRQLRAVVASGPVALRVAVGLGHTGYSSCFGLSAGKVSSVPSGHTRVTCPVASS